LDRRHLLLRPRLQQLVELRLSEQAWERRVASAGPDAGEIDGAVRELRRGTLGVGRFPRAVLTTEPSRQLLGGERRRERGNRDRSEQCPFHGRLSFSSYPASVRRIPCRR